MIQTEGIPEFKIVAKFQPCVNYNIHKGIYIQTNATETNESMRMALKDTFTL